MKLDSGILEIWWTHLRDVDPDPAVLLSDDERKRSALYAQADDRQRFVLGCALVRVGLSHFLGMPTGDIEIVRRCARCGGPHGKPEVIATGDGEDRVRFSVSHAGRLVGVAFFRGAAVGLDVEPRDRPVDVARVASRVLASAERLTHAQFCEPLAQQKFLQTWTRKEALVKCVGLGTRAGLGRIQVTAPDQSARLVAWDSRPDLVDALSLMDVAVDADHVAALAVYSPKLPVVRSRMFSGLPPLG